MNIHFWITFSSANKPAKALATARSIEPHPAPPDIAVFSGKDHIVRRFKFAGMATTLCLLGGCSINDSHTAFRAQKSLLGMTEVALQTCMGAPDQKSTFGATEILTYYATSTSSTSLSIPLIGGIGESYGGYCHTIIRLDDGIVDGVRYTGETTAFVAPNAYCAPTVRGCVNNPPAPLTPNPYKAASATEANSALRRS